MKRVKVYCCSCGRPFRKMVKDRYDAWYLKMVRDDRQLVEFCNQCVDEARDLLDDAPNERLAHGVYVADMRGYGHVPELPEAALREGVAYITIVIDRDGRRKVVLGGHTTPEMVRAFLDTWAPSQGLTDLYGDPARGFAGGYLPTHNSPWGWGELEVRDE